MTEYMDYQFASYAKFIRKFYDKIIQGHPSSSQFNQKLNSIINQVQKADKEHISISRLNRKKSDLSVSSHSKFSHSRNHNNHKNRHNKNHKNQGSFSSQNFGTVFSFAYIFFIINTENEDVLKMIETKVRLLSDADFKQKSFDKSNWDHCVMQWKKVLYLLEHKKTVKWEKILNTSFSSFSEKFSDIILRSILNVGLNINLQVKPTQQFFKKASTQLKLSIIYFQCSEAGVQNKVVYGNFKHSINLGFSTDCQHFVCYQKVPNSPNQLNIIQSDKYVNETINSPRTPIKKQQRTADTFRAEAKTQKLITSYRRFNQVQKLSNSPTKTSNTYSKMSRTAISYNLIKRKTMMTIEFLLKQYNKNTQKFYELQCLSKQVKKRSSKLSQDQDLNMNTD